MTPLSQQPVCLHIDCRALQLAMQVPVAEPTAVFVQLAMHTFCSPLQAIGAASIVSAVNKKNPIITAMAEIALWGIATLSCPTVHTPTG
ncbi:MAG: hypothetical protein HY244_04215 [Rhizobiales bacterium]|nr:hypothetical protein [Hyphomicrobiales bacterium]